MLPPRRLLVAAAVFASLAILLYFNSGILFSAGFGYSRSVEPTADPFPRKIWQTWREPAQGLENELQRFAKSWADLNPDYRYELLTDESALTYVREHFGNRQDIVHVFEQNHLKIFRADFLRYLVLLADGGVYTDIDTHCTKPIDTWIPPQYLTSASLVVGLEYDAQGGEIISDFVLPVNLGQWAFMAKAGNSALEHVVGRVEEALNHRRQQEANQTSPRPPTYREVLDITGPTIFTKAIFEYLNAREGRTVAYSEISNITEPKLIGDVLFLTISAFASGQSHSGSKPWDNDEQLLAHHWRASWRDKDTG